MTDKMNVVINSDGTPAGTTLVLDGKELKNVKVVEFKVSGNEFPTLKLELLDVDVKIDTMIHENHIIDNFVGKSAIPQKVLSKVIDSFAKTGVIPGHGDKLGDGYLDLSGLPHEVSIVKKKPHTLQEVSKMPMKSKYFSKESKVFVELKGDSVKCNGVEMSVVDGMFDEDGAHYYADNHKLFIEQAASFASIFINLFLDGCPECESPDTAFIESDPGDNSVGMGPFAPVLNCADCQHSIELTSSDMEELAREIQKGRSKF